MDFGFSLSQSSTVNLDKTDLSLFHRVHEIEPDVAICMACGSCSATCTSSEFTGMSLRRLILTLGRVFDGEDRNTRRDIRKEVRK